MAAVVPDITAADRLKHTATFNSLKPTDGLVSGSRASTLFKRSGLGSDVLAHVWKLCDLNQDGRMNVSEFVLAMHLITVKMKGGDIPKELPRRLDPAADADLPPLDAPTADKYRQHFERFGKEHLSATKVHAILRKSELSRKLLAQIWRLSDVDQDNRLSQDEFVLAMHLTTLAKTGLSMPAALPPHLAPDGKQPLDNKGRRNTDDLKKQFAADWDVAEEKARLDAERHAQGAAERHRLEEEERRLTEQTMREARAAAERKAVEEEALRRARLEEERLKRLAADKRAREEMKQGISDLDHDPFASALSDDPFATLSSPNPLAHADTAFAEDPFDRGDPFADDFEDDLPPGSPPPLPPPVPDALPDSDSESDEDGETTDPPPIVPASKLLPSEPQGSASADLELPAPDTEAPVPFSVVDALKPSFKRRDSGNSVTFHPETETAVHETYSGAEYDRSNTDMDPEINSVEVEFEVQLDKIQPETDKFHNELADLRDKEEARKEKQSTATTASEPEADVAADDDYAAYQKRREEQLQLAAEQQRAAEEDAAAAAEQEAAAERAEQEAAAAKQAAEAEAAARKAAELAEQEAAKRKAEADAAKRAADAEAAARQAAERAAAQQAADAEAATRKLADAEAAAKRAAERAAASAEADAAATRAAEAEAAALALRAAERDAGLRAAGEATLKAAAEEAARLAELTRQAEEREAARKAEDAARQAADEEAARSAAAARRAEDEAASKRLAADGETAAEAARKRVAAEAEAEAQRLEAEAERRRQKRETARLELERTMATEADAIRQRAEQAEQERREAAKSREARGREEEAQFQERRASQQALREQLDHKLRAEQQSWLNEIDETRAKARRASQEKARQALAELERESAARETRRRERRKSRDLEPSKALAIDSKLAEKRELVKKMSNTWLKDESMRQAQLMAEDRDLQELLERKRREREARREQRLQERQALDKEAQDKLGGAADVLGHTSNGLSAVTAQLSSVAAPAPTSLADTYQAERERAKHEFEAQQAEAGRLARERIQRELDEQQRLDDANAQAARERQQRLDDERAQEREKQRIAKQEAERRKDAERQERLQSEKKAREQREREEHEREMARQERLRARNKHNLRLSTPVSEPASPGREPQSPQRVSSSPRGRDPVSPNRFGRSVSGPSSDIAAAFNSRDAGTVGKASPIKLDRRDSSTLRNQALREARLSISRGKAGFMGSSSEREEQEHLRREEKIKAANEAEEVRKQQQQREEALRQERERQERREAEEARKRTEAAAAQGRTPEEKMRLKQAQKCGICEKRVYFLERIVADDQMFHKHCFRCSVCNSMLRVDNFQFVGNVLYCRAHYQHLSRMTGARVESKEASTKLRRLGSNSDEQAPVDPSWRDRRAEEWIPPSERVGADTKNVDHARNIVKKFEQKRRASISAQKPVIFRRRSSIDSSDVATAVAEAKRRAEETKQRELDEARAEREAAEKRAKEARALADAERNADAERQRRKAAQEMGMFMRTQSVSGSSPVRQFAREASGGARFVAAAPAKAPTPARVAAAPVSTPPASPRSKGDKSCMVCGKPVYFMEQVKIEGMLFHKQCLRCTQCNTKLSSGNYALGNGKMYCKTHHTQLFKLRGNYDEGFGTTQRKKDFL